MGESLDFLMGLGACGLALLFASAFAAPVTPAIELKELASDTSDGVDATKNYVLYIYDSHSCDNDKAAKCTELESAVANVLPITKESDSFSKYRENLEFVKVNKDNFPSHKKEFEKAKLSLPAILFWPAGHFKPSCKLESTHPSSTIIADWLSTNLKTEESTLIQEEDPSTHVCKADDKSSSPAEGGDVACSDIAEKNAPQGLMQLEKTQKIWDFKAADTKFLGPADNSLPHTVNTANTVEMRSLDSSSYSTITKQGVYQALYFHAPWCKYCDCLEPVWRGVSSNLVETKRQPQLVVAEVDGDANPELRNLFNVTVYPTFVLVNKEGSKALGRYLGPRKVFELSTWIEDLIVADENPILKHEFQPSEQGEHPDLYPTFPYSGSKAFGLQALASLSVQVTGNDFDECSETDEAKFTAPGAALLVHYSSDPNTIKALEMDSISPSTVPSKLTVIDFFAPWCPHCQKLNPVWDSVSSHFANSEVSVGKVDVEAHADIKRSFGIHRFPTIMYFEAGKPMQPDEARRYTGSRDEQSLTQWINQLKH